MVDMNPPYTHYNTYLVRPGSLLSDELLQADGWSKSGCGVHAVVYTRDNEALKIFAVSDGGYTSWLKKAPQGGAFPQRLSEPISIFFEDVSTTWNGYAVYMERLEPVSADIGEIIQEISYMLQSMQTPHIANDIIEAFTPVLGRNIFDAMQLALVINEDSVVGDYSYAYTMDIIRDNIMVRPSTGELVLTDPLG